MYLNDNSNANANKGSCSSKNIVYHEQQWKEREFKKHNKTANLFEDGDELNEAFVVFQHINNTIKTCEKFISIHSNGVDYFCNLCNCIIEHSSNGQKFRFSLWRHLNEETHQEKIKQSQEQNILASIQLKKALASFELDRQEKEFTSKQFITKKSECNAYHCNLCDVEVFYSSDDNEFRFNLLSHINEKKHKLQLTTAIKLASGKDMKAKKKDGLIKIAAFKECKVNDGQRMNDQGEYTIGNISEQFKNFSIIESFLPEPSSSIIKTNKFVEDAKILEAVKTSEDKYIDTVEVKKPKEIKALEKDMVLRNKPNEELQKVFDSLVKSNPVTNESKKFIYQFEKEKDYHCTLCDVRISCPSNDNEFRFNLWSHINMETHREKLPNYTLMVRSFETAKVNFSKSLPGKYKADADYFMIGPVFRFAKCSLCNVAVSLKYERLFKHIRGQEHTENRLALLGRKVSIIPPEVRCGKEYAVLKSKIDGKFSKDVTFIQSGVMAGYVICIACCQVVIATKYRLETHFQDKKHIEWLRRVKKSKVSKATRIRKAVKTSEGKDIDTVEVTKPEETKAFKRDMVVQNETNELEKVFHSFDQSNPVTNESIKFIYQFEKEKDYHCTLCDVRISCPSNDNEFRFNLWSHINMETHREKLPNYTLMVRSFETAKVNFSKSIPELYKADADYFMIGPVFRFAKCNLCNVAVSLKHERLFKHIRGQEHTENRLALLGQKVSIIPPEVRCGKEYAVLKSKIDGKFSKDVTFIQSGVMAGYVICIACCQVVIANKCHLETHFQHKNHIENPWLRLVNKSKISLDALMQNMPEDLKAYKDIFVEDECGVRCSRCQEVIPATTCKLYDHITKERTRI